MSGSLWSRRPRPASAPDPSSVWRWEPSSAAELTAQRRRLDAALHDGGRPDQASESAVEKLLLAFEELVSNGLRHGYRPFRSPSAPHR